MKTLEQLSADGKEQLALAILLWKDFKSGGKFDVEVSMQAFDLAKMLGITTEYNKLMTVVPPMKIKPR